MYFIDFSKIKLYYSQNKIYTLIKLSGIVLKSIQKVCNNKQHILHFRWFVIDVTWFFCSQRMFVVDTPVRDGQEFAHDKSKGESIIIVSVISCIVLLIALMISYVIIKREKIWKTRTRERSMDYQIEAYSCDLVTNENIMGHTGCK